MIKKLSFFILLFIKIVAVAQVSKGDWYNNIELALDKANKTHKKTLVYFSGSDWCKPCMELKTTVFSSESFKKKAAEDYVLVNIDFPRNRNKLTENQRKYIEKSAAKYNPSGIFPLVVLLDDSGLISTSIEGYRGETALYYIKNYLK